MCYFLDFLFVFSRFWFRSSFFANWPKCVPVPKHIRLDVVVCVCVWCDHPGVKDEWEIHTNTFFACTLPLICNIKTCFYIKTDFIPCEFLQQPKSKVGVETSKDRTILRMRTIPPPTLNMMHRICFYKHIFSVIKNVSFCKRFPEYEAFKTVSKFNTFSVFGWDDYAIWTFCYIFFVFTFSKSSTVSIFPHLHDVILLSPSFFFKLIWFFFYSWHFFQVPPSFTCQISFDWRLF